MVTYCHFVVRCLVTVATLKIIVIEDQLPYQITYTRQTPKHMKIEVPL